MWDEKKFFEDYTAQVDKIQPTPEFMEKMMSMTCEEKTSKVTGFRRVKVWGPIAAAACIAFVVGGIYFVQPGQSGQSLQDTKKNQMGLVADKEGQGNTEFYNFSASESDKLQILKNELEKDAIIMDELRIEVSQEKKEELLDDIQNAVLAEEPNEKETDASYIVVGEQEIRVERIKDGYLMIEIDGEESFYSINE